MERAARKEHRQNLDKKPRNTDLEAFLPATSPAASVATDPEQSGRARI